MTKVLYIHGFSSCAKGNKSLALASYFGEESVVSLELPPSPLDVIKELGRAVKRLEPKLLVGSSLGGFYATYLAEHYHVKAVLINPSTQPWDTLSDYVGWQQRFCNDEMFEFKSVYLEQLKELKTIPQKGKYLVLLQSGDEVLDYTKAQALYANQKIVVQSGGNHRFENLEEYLKMIENFMTPTRKKRDIKYECS